MREKDSTSLDLKYDTSHPVVTDSHISKCTWWYAVLIPAGLRRHRLYGIYSVAEKTSVDFVIYHDKGMELERYTLYVPIIFLLVVFLQNIFSS